MVSNVQPITYSHSQLLEVLPRPSRDDNKYTRGHLFVVAGCAAYPGAACLASSAAQRAGAGYTETICAPQTALVVRIHRPSLVVRPWDEWDVSNIPASTNHHPVACAVGSGFDGNDPNTNALAVELFRTVQGPLLVDGGAISALATDEGRKAALTRAENGWPTVVTPHGGEALRLARALDGEELGWSDTYRSLDAPAQALALAQKYQSVITLKGPDTFISDGSCVVAMTQGTPALAKAGTGDVLAGIIGALLAQQVAPLDACVLGATLHAEAGSIAARDSSEASVIPEDVVEAIPFAIAAI